MKHSDGQKRILTAIVAFSFFTYGFGGSLFGPTSRELESHFHVDTTTVSYGLTTAAAMQCVGAIFFGWAFNVFHRQSQFIVQLLGSGLAVLLIPFMTDIKQFIGASAINGFLSGGILTLMNVLVLEIWREKSNPYLQAVHFIYALGNMAGPLVSAQFAPQDQQQMNSSEAVTVTFLHKSISALVLYPYTIAGSLLTGAAIIVTAYELLHPYERPERGINKKADEKDYKMRSVPLIYVLLFVSLSSISFGSFLNIESVTGAYLVKFLENGGLSISPNKAMYLQSILNGSHTSMRVICIFLSARVQAKYIICGCLTGIFVSNSVLYLFYSSSEPMVVACLVVFGASLSPVYPSLHAFVEKHIDETNIISAIFTIFSLLPLAVTPLIISGSMNSNPVVLVYSNLCSVITLIVTFSSLLYLARQHFTPPKDKLKTDVEMVKYEKRENAL